MSNTTSGNKVCHITSVHKRYDVRIFHKECMSLAEQGFEVILLVADGKGNELKNNINIIDVGREKGRIRRFFRTLKNIKNKALLLDCDLYHFHDPELLFVGNALKKAGKKVVWDMHENLPADIMQKKYIPWLLRILITYIFKKLEKHTVKKIDGIICTRDSVLYRLHGLNDNIELVNNFPLTNYRTPEIESRERAICFAGAIVPNYQHKEIIQAIENIPDVKYYLAGPIKPNYINELKSLKGWSKVEYMGVVPFEKVKEIYAKSSIGMVVHKYTPNMDYKIGNFALTKIFEVMYWGIPVVCTDYKIWRDEVFSKYDCAISVEPDNITSIKQSIQFLLDNPQIAQQKGQNGKQAVEESFNWYSQEVKLCRLYNNILNNAE